MRFYVKTKRFVALFCAASMFMLCSCARMGGPTLFNDDGQKADARLERVIQAINDKDKDALKAMFSQQALSEAEDLDGRVDYVFDFIQGDIVSWTSMVSGPDAENTHNGQIVKISTSWYSVKTDTEEYLFFLKDYTVDTAHPENVGLYFLQVIKMKDKETQFNWANRQNAGIYKPDPEDTDDGSTSPAESAQGDS